MRILNMAKTAFRTLNPVSLGILYAGLEFTAGLLLASLVLTLLTGRVGDMFSMLNTAAGLKQAALTCGALAAVAALFGDMAVKDRQNGRL